jgi:hypothetical protein
MFGLGKKDQDSKQVRASTCVHRALGALQFAPKKRLGQAT